MVGWLIELRRCKTFRWAVLNFLAGAARTVAVEVVLGEPMRPQM
jgi:hypothetical protein